MGMAAARTATNGSETRRKGSGVSFESHEDTIGMVGIAPRPSFFLEVGETSRGSSDF